MNPHIKITRESFATRIHRYCDEHGLSCESQTKNWGQGLQLKWIIDGGEPLTPREAEERYLKERCEAPSILNATSAERYTTCNTVLDDNGTCPHADQHVEL